MRRFVVLGHRASTSGNFNLNDLCGSAGRLDILTRCVNSAFFISHDLRRNVELYLILLGEPNPPKTIKLIGKELKYLNPDERSTAALLRNALAKKVDKEWLRASPGIYISSKGFEDILAEYSNRSEIIVLKEEGIDIRAIVFDEETTFVLSDDKNFNEEEDTVLDRYASDSISLGPLSLHAEHCITIVHNELDRQALT